MDKIKARKGRLTATIFGTLLSKEFNPSKYDHWLPIEGEKPATQTNFNQLIK